MQRVRFDDPPYDDFPWPPTEDDLPSSDGMPMETWRHVLQMYLLIDALLHAWRDRTDVFVGGNMFVYFSPDQVLTEDFRGPDVFVVLGVPRRSRKSWVVWQEGKAPDVVIELLSDTTRNRDRTEKKQIYQDKLRVPEYFWFDPWTGEFAGFALREGVYEPIAPEAEGSIPSRVLGLKLVRWEGEWRREEAVWLRWATPDGVLLPTEQETAEQERVRAEDAQRRIAELESRLAQYEHRADE